MHVAVNFFNLSNWFMGQIVYISHEKDQPPGNFRNGRFANGLFWWKKPKQGYENFFSQLSNLSQPVFLLENPTHWGLKTAVCPIFAKPILDNFAVCSLVPSMNLFHTQQSYLCPKNQNCLLEKADFRFFLN